MHPGNLGGAALHFQFIYFDQYQEGYSIKNTML